MRSVLNGVLLSLAIMLAAAFPLTLHAQSYTNLHVFSGRPDGAAPYAGLARDRAGNLYGVTAYGGSSSQSGGLVFKLSHLGAGWVMSPLHSFPATNTDGMQPEAAVTIAPDGNVYGTTSLGGSGSSGIVFKLTPPASVQDVIFPFPSKLKLPLLMTGG